MYDRSSQTKLKVSKSCRSIDVCICRGNNRSLYLQIRQRVVRNKFSVHVCKYIHICPGGVAQWSSHPSEEQKNRVRVPPGFKVFEGKHSNVVD
jgi:hypothetical protein